jgi:hypothetical protein
MNTVFLSTFRCVAPSRRIAQRYCHNLLTRPGQSTFTTRIPKTTNMSTFSNTDTGSKNADPYTQKNLEDPSLKEKVEDLLDFVDKTKFCLLTTQTADSDLLASRAMALAAKVHYLTRPTLPKNQRS